MSGDALKFCDDIDEALRRDERRPPYNGAGFVLPRTHAMLRVIRAAVKAHRAMERVRDLDRPSLTDDPSPMLKAHEALYQAADALGAELSALKTQEEA